MKHEIKMKTSRGALDMQRMRYPRWDNRVIKSPGDKEHVEPNRASGLRLSKRYYQLRMVAHLRRESGRKKPR